MYENIWGSIYYSFINFNFNYLSITNNCCVQINNYNKGYWGTIIKFYITILNLKNPYGE